MEAAGATCSPPCRCGRRRNCPRSNGTCWTSSPRCCRQKNSSRGRANTKRTSAISSTASRTCSDNLKLWPALDFASVDDLLLAALDDFSPTASEELDNGVRVFFASREHRDRAQAAFRARRIAAVPIEVSDEDW